MIICNEKHKKITYDFLHSWQCSNNIKSKIKRSSGLIHQSKVSRGEKLTRRSLWGNRRRELGTPKR
jgi:hypothetical protein